MLLMNPGDSSQIEIRKARISVVASQAAHLSLIALAATHTGLCRPLQAMQALQAITECHIREEDTIPEAPMLALAPGPM